MDFMTLGFLQQYVSNIISQGGITGTNGKSAYEIATENGFIGTEEEWLNSLQGTTPHIGENNNWFIGDVDTGILASPDLSKYYSQADLIALTSDEILEICK